MFRRRIAPRPWQLALGAGLAVLILVGPFAQSWLLERAGARGMAAIGLAWSLAVLAWRRGPAEGTSPGLGAELGTWPVATIAALCGAALVSGAVVFVRLLPAVIYLSLVVLFVRSLASEPGGFIGRLARLVDAFAPDFIDPYCKKLTVLWATLFGVHGVVIAALALSRRGEAWALYAGALSWAITAAFQVVEFFVRKLWFRHYGRSPLDKVLARVFPAENTPEGRRSLAHIRAMRARLAAEAERTT